MPVFLLFLLIGATASLATGQSFLREAAETNINQRYFIESVSLGGVEVDRMDGSKLPVRLRDRLEALVGQKCDMAGLEDLSAEIRRELHFRTVSQHLLKGSAPGQVKVDFDVAGRDVSFDVSVPRLLFTSDQKATGEVDANIGFEGNKLTVGAVTNGDDLIERFAGLTARFDTAPLGTDRLHGAVIFEDYHDTWNAATQDAVAGSGLDLYRARWDVAPQLTFAATSSVSVSTGFSFEQMESESTAIGSRSANAATLDVHYGRKIDGGPIRQRIDGIYSLRVATRALGSTYAYARHIISFKYEASYGRHETSDELIAGAIAGEAPLFDRFVLGSSSTLRGWDRFDIDPLGGTRVIHNELSYGYRIGEGTVQTFYDAGVLRQPGAPGPLRHSLGFGYKQGIFVMATAFPVREGRIEPVFMAGMNY